MTKEIDLEKQLITQLSEELKYTYRSDLRTKQALEENFRKKFEDLNGVRLTDTEFAKLQEQIITADVFAAAQCLREKNTLMRDDNTPLDYTLVNLKEWCRNDFEVIHQLRMSTQQSHQRYDVILLINGIPVVQIELKSLEVSPRRAMQQIVNYKREAGNGYGNSLLCFIQLFIVSNRSNTYYFSNNNETHFSFNADEQFLPVYQLAQANNKKITHLEEFTPKFLSKCALGEMISKYMVLVQSEQKLLIMRPYQIYAVKAIIDCIEQNRSNGYIWHTTGSGKTLTSFKASTILKDNPNIHKCLFVVDRKDLDRQTREEFNKFQPGCVEENTNTESLVRRLLSEDYANKVIVTTIQKLGLALKNNEYKNLLQELQHKRMIFIFDECHRSQFGDNHKAIKEFFPNAQLFGFTGTPIFNENALYKQYSGSSGSYLTTQDVFQHQLHAYTITHAIDDKNVLRFHIDYFKPEQNLSIGSPEHQAAVANTILKKHDAATNQRRFNAVLATASINEAIAYYQLFQTLQAKRSQEDPTFVPLNIACIFSPPAEGNKDVQQLQEDLEQEKEDNKVEPEAKKQALQAIIADYNRQYKTNHRLTEFDQYYQDLQQRIKFQRFPNAELPREHKIDLIIVVDMLLTGFDSKYLNTLYVDKNLKYHSLIQAFSRTNRVLNDTKPYGNILDFRQQQAQVDEAIVLFSGEAGERAKEIWLIEPAAKVIEKYQQAVQAMSKWMNDKDLASEPQETYNIQGDSAKIEFINRFKEVQRLKTQLDQYTDLSPSQKEEIENLIPEDKLRSFRSAYLELAKDFKEKQQKEGDKASPALQQLDFEFVLFSSALVDYDYIMGLIANYTQQQPKKQKISQEQLISLLSSSANLMDEREDIQAYIQTLEMGKALSTAEIKQGYQQFKAHKLEQELLALAAAHSLDPEALQQFIQLTLARLIFDAQELTTLFEHLNLGWRKRVERELALMNELSPLLKKMAQGRSIAGLETYDEA